MSEAEFGLYRAVLGVLGAGKGIPWGEWGFVGVCWDEMLGFWDVQGCVGLSEAV